MRLLGQIQSLCVSRFSIFKSVCHFDWSAPSNLKSVVHESARRECVDAKTCAWIVHLQLVDGFASLVLNIGIDPVALVTPAAYRRQQGESDRDDR